VMREFSGVMRGDGQVTQCPLTLKRGGWDVFVRAVSDAGGSDWYQGASAGISSCTDADAAAGVCEEFDTGPGGGFVFHDAGSRQSWGRYLEAAPAGWSGSTDDPQMQWCAKDQANYKSSLATGEGIGSGAPNTQVIIQNCGTDNAAGLAAAHQGGGKSDWFLPSKDELDKLYGRRTEVGGLADYNYWPSSQFSGDARHTWCQAMGGPDTSVQDDFSKDDFFGVRPVRAF
jgi:hypothetical protein